MRSVEDALRFIRWRAFWVIVAAALLIGPYLWRGLVFENRHGRSSSADDTIATSFNPRWSAVAADVSYPEVLRTDETAEITADFHFSAQRFGFRSGDFFSFDAPVKCKLAAPGFEVATTLTRTFVSPDKNDPEHVTPGARELHCSWLVTPVHEGRRSVIVTGVVHRSDAGVRILRKCTEREQSASYYPLCVSALYSENVLQASVPLNVDVEDDPFSWERVATIAGLITASITVLSAVGGAFSRK